MRHHIASLLLALAHVIHRPLFWLGRRLGVVGRFYLPEALFSARAMRVVDISTAAAGAGPRFSVVMPVADPAPEVLSAAIQSLTAQTYPHWRLVIADDGSGDGVQDVLARHANNDRIRVVRSAERSGVSAATDRARAAADGDWLLFLDHDDVLAPHALATLAAAVNTHPDCVLVYGDEAHLGPNGQARNAAYKSAWNPALLLGQNYVNHPCAVRADAIAAVGGLRSTFDGAQDLDLLLRLAETHPPSAFLHAPGVTYLWRQDPRSHAISRTAPVRAADAGKRAVEDALQRRDLRGDVTLTMGGWRRVVFERPTAKVSVLVPTRNNPRRLKRCLKGFSRAIWPDIELIVVDHDNTDADARRLIDAQHARSAHVLPWTGAFNYAGMMNAAARAASGELLLLLNDDIEPLNGAWLSTLAARFAESDVSAAGPALLYPSGLYQHTGLTLGIGGGAGSRLKHTSCFRKGPFGRLILARDVSAVTGACMLVRKTAWDEIGGMDEAFPVAFNDVDFCLRLRTAGHRIVWEPAATLIHHEGATRGRDQSPANAARLAADLARLKEKWGDALTHDPFDHPAFALNTEDLRACSVNARPRTNAPYSAA